MPTTPLPPVPPSSPDRRMPTNGTMHISAVPDEEQPSSAFYTFEEAASSSKPPVAPVPGPVRSRWSLLQRVPRRRLLSWGIPLLLALVFAVVLAFVPLAEPASRPPSGHPVGVPTAGPTRGPIVPTPQPTPVPIPQTTLGGMSLGIVAGWPPDLTQADSVEAELIAQQFVEREMSDDYRSLATLRSALPFPLE